MRGSRFIIFKTIKQLFNEMKLLLTAQAKHCNNLDNLPNTPPSCI